MNAWGRSVGVWPDLVHIVEHPLFKEDSFDSAKQKCERVSEEFEAMDRHEWCRRYSVPESFFS